MGKKKGVKESEAWKLVKQIPAYLKVRQHCCCHPAVREVVSLDMSVLRVNGDVCALQPVVHYTFIPLIIVLGMRFTEPRPTIAQLLGPM